MCNYPHFPLIEKYRAASTASSTSSKPPLSKIKVPESPADQAFAGVILESTRPAKTRPEELCATVLPNIPGVQQNCRTLVKIIQAYDQWSRRYQQKA